MKLKEIKKHYIVEKITKEDKYNIYSLNNNTYTPKSYICTIERNKNAYRVLPVNVDINYEFTYSFDSLNGQINNYISKLPFDTEIYNPMYRDGYMETTAIYRFFSENFNDMFTSNDGTYSITTKDFLGEKQRLSTIFLNNFSIHKWEEYTTDDKVKIYESVDGDLMKYNLSINAERNALDIIETINYVLRLRALSNIETNLKILAVTDNYKANNGEIVKMGEDYKIYKENFKDKILPRLKKMIGEIEAL